MANRDLTFIDTNILLDLFTNDQQWADWSIRQLDLAAAKGRLAINPVVYAELSVRFDRIETLDAVLDDSKIVVLESPRSALFLAGKAFLTYRAAGGLRTGVLPYFFVGAHAAVMNRPLMTRDVSRYRRHFPSLTLIAPP